MKKLVLLVCLFSSWIYAAKVGLLVMATGKYIQFVQPLIDSADRYFCPEDDVIYFVFTDGQLPKRDDIVQIYQGRLGWPYDTMMRCRTYLYNYDAWQEMDYVFACDADMLFVDTVGREVLSDRVATQHPGFVGKRGTYETRSQSTACVARNEGQYYFAGGFHGGSSTEFYKLVSTMVANIEADLVHDFVAVWHDESHLNRYFIDNPPTKVLSPSYCYPGNKRLAKQFGLGNCEPRLVALVKNHQELLMIFNQCN